MPKQILSKIVYKILSQFTFLLRDICIYDGVDCMDGIYVQ